MSCGDPFKIEIPGADHDPEPDVHPVLVVPADGSDVVLGADDTGSEPVPGSGSDVVLGGSEPGTDVLPAIDAPGARTSTARHLGQQVWLWAREFATSQKKRSRLAHRIWDWGWNGHADSLGELRAYRKSRKWLDIDWPGAKERLDEAGQPVLDEAGQPVPGWFTGWLKVIVEWENVAFLTLISTPLTFIGESIIRTGQRQSRTGLVLLAAGIIITVWYVTGH